MLILKSESIPPPRLPTISTASCILPSSSTLQLHCLIWDTKQVKLSLALTSFLGHFPLKDWLVFYSNLTFKCHFSEGLSWPPSDFAESFVVAFTTFWHFSWHLRLFLTFSNRIQALNCLNVSVLFTALLQYCE